MTEIKLYDVTEDQLDVIEKFMNNHKIKFDITNDDVLTEWQQNEIKEGLKNISEGKFSSSNEVSRGARKIITEK